MFSSKGRRRVQWFVAALCSLMFVGSAWLSYLNAKNAGEQLWGWLLLFGFFVSISAVCILMAVRVSEKPFALRRLESMPPVDSHLSMWHTGTLIQGNLKRHQYYAALVFTANSVYIATPFLKPVAEAIKQAEQVGRVVNLLESNFPLGVSRKFKKFQISGIQSVETWDGQLVFNTDQGVATFDAFQNPREVAAMLAARIFPGVQPVTGAATNSNAERIMYRRTVTGAA